MEKSNDISQEELELIERFWKGQFTEEAEEYKLRERYLYDSLWHEKADWVRLMMLSVEELVWEEKLREVSAFLKVEKSRALKLRLLVNWGLIACLILLLILCVYLYLVK